jgi:hypothetical protein
MLRRFRLFVDLLGLLAALPGGMPAVAASRQISPYPALPMLP